MRRWSWLALGALLFFVGCEEIPSTPEPPGLGQECARIGQRCVTEEGPVGVCNETDRSRCDEPPCLACMPQH